MKRKYLYLAFAALLAAGGLWFAQSTWRSDHSALPRSSTDSALNEPSGGPEAGQLLRPPNPGQMLRPPNPTQRFRDFTPEQRVKFARKGTGPGG